MPQKYKPSPEVLAEKKRWRGHQEFLVNGIKDFANQTKALVLLDDVCGPLYYGAELPTELTDEQKNEIINRVYIYAHGADTTNTCYHVHTDYRKQIDRDYALHVKGKRVSKL